MMMSWSSLGKRCLDPSAPAWHQIPVALEKYTEASRRFGENLDRLAQAYSIAFRVYPSHLR